MRQLLPEADLTSVAADVATPKGCAALFAQAPEVDILVNNVGTARLTNFLDQEDGEWLDRFQLNFAADEHDPTPAALDHFRQVVASRPNAAHDN
jgi:short-subunit dehydrogenase